MKLVKPECPACGATIGERQRWCMECGTAARTTLARPPRWTLRGAAVATAVTLIALAAVGYALAALAA